MEKTRIENYEVKKEEAMKRFEVLEHKGFSKQVINAFKKENKLFLFERQNSLFCATQYDIELNSGDNDKYDELLEAINNFEKKYDALVYAVQLTHFEFGECYSFFYVSGNPDDYDYDISDLKENYAYVYTWNKTDDYCSEFGTIGFEVKYGGIVRTA